MTRNSCHPHPKEIAPVHLSTVILRTTHSMNFILFSNYLVSKVSMVTPKVNICSPFVGKTRISLTRYLFIHQASERYESWRKNMKFAPSRPPGSSYNTLPGKKYSEDRISCSLNITLSNTRNAV